MCVYFNISIQCIYLYILYIHICVCVNAILTSFKDIDAQTLNVRIVRAYFLIIQATWKQPYW